MAEFTKSELEQLKEYTGILDFCLIGIYGYFNMLILKVWFVILVILNL